MPEQRTRYRLILEVLPGNTPAVIRLRHFLKLALRAWGLRALEVGPMPMSPPPPPVAETETYGVDRGQEVSHYRGEN
jgi:hypothetical protein